MSRLESFKLPDLGEGLTEGEILQWMVAPGDEVKLNQIIVEVETAKAAVEVPSPFAGVVVQIHHGAGTTVDVGSPIVTFDTDPTAGPLDTPTSAPTASTGPESDPASQASAVATAAEVASDTVPLPAGQAADAAAAETPAGDGGRTANLVGYGPWSSSAKRRQRNDQPPAPVPPVPAPQGTASSNGRGAVKAQGTVLAKPPVRKLAKDLGVDLSKATGTGPDGTITRADVEAAASSSSTQETQAAPASYGPATRERRIPVKGVRKHTAAAMAASAFTAPHVTEFITLDMTPTMELRTKIAKLPEFRDVKVTPLLFVTKALLLAVKRNPEINATWDEDAQEIVVKDYVNLGIAAATPRGLMVPNVKDADAMSLPELALALQSLTETAKAGKTQPADMTGGTITITNVGVFGVDNGTPIINPGESAILCFGAVRPTPWVVDGEIVVRQVTQLSLSFDHRNVDGQLGSQFLSDVARVLSDPTTALVWG